eukprot:TRINITY_DN3556_c0_g1_i1.p5 TRINITY_DN3556_c0_g1~~TRINITY_DN3556_c0_g1_i1.p5  ORF type:complete len:162 (+),score=9.85 TRINITY_DN3556_c0_g1_i1:375-860(+)
MYSLVRKTSAMCCLEVFRYVYRPISSMSARESAAQVAARLVGSLKSQIPSLQQALQVTDHACVITEAQYPYRICHVNQAWADMCGWKPEEVVGNTLAMIQGPSTSMDTKSEMHRVIKNKQEGVFILVNYKKDGSPFFNKIGLIPLKKGSEVTHFMGLSQKL